MSTELFTMKQLRDVIGNANTVRAWIRAGLLVQGKLRKLGVAWQQVWTPSEIDDARRRRELGEERLRNDAARLNGARRSIRFTLDEIGRAAQEECCG